MAELTLLTAAGAAVVGGGISIGSQLIVAYLKNEKRNNCDKSPIVTADPVVIASDCRKKRMEFVGWKSEVDKSLVEQKSGLEGHEKLLEKGDKDFNAIKKDIAGLNTSYAVLAERIQQKKGIVVV